MNPRGSGIYLDTKIVSELLKAYAAYKLDNPEVGIYKSQSFEGFMEWLNKQYVLSAQSNRGDIT